jgi:hypothetical protein
MIDGAVFNVLDYGAIGNGLVDDTAAIQSAFTAAKTIPNGAGVLFFPKGTYSVTGLDFDCSNLSVHFLGEGPDCTIIKKRGASTAPVIKMYSSSNNKNIIFQEIELDADYVALVDCLQLVDLSSVHVKNCTTWKSARYAINCQSVLVSTFEQSRISNALDGIVFDLSATPGARYNNHNVIRDCKILGNSRRGISLANGSNLRVLSCDIEQNGEEGVITHSAIYIYDSIDAEAGYGLVSVDGCWLEGNQGTGIYAEGASGGVVNVSNTFIIASPTGGSAGECIYTETGLRTFNLMYTMCIGGTGTAVVNSENFESTGCFIGTLSNGATNYSIFGVKTAVNDSIQQTNRLSFPVVDRATVPNENLFNDLATGKLAWKDSAGVVNVLY